MDLVLVLAMIVTIGEVHGVKTLNSNRTRKNKKSTVVVNDYVHNMANVEVDSSEEYYVYHWLMEAMKLGIVVDFEYQPEAFLLTDKAKYIPAFGNPKQKEKHLLADHVYTADFKVLFNATHGEKLSEYFKIPIEAVDVQRNIATVVIDVKGGFMLHGGDRTFSIHQKLVWEKYKVYVQKVVPEDLFKKLGMPEAAKYTIKTKKPTVKFVGCKKLEDFLNH